MIRFIYIILVLIAIYFIASYLFKILLPHLMRRLFDKAGIRYEQEPKQKKEGSVTVTGKKRRNKQFTKSDGDYIDYKEVKD